MKRSSLTTGAPDQHFHGFIGYWGAADAASMDRRLRLLLQATGRQGWLTRSSWQGASLASNCDDPSPIWQVASIGSANEVRRHFADLHAAKGSHVLAAHSASWRTTYIHSDGSLYPDAWVISINSSGSCAARLQLGRDPFGRQPLFWLKEDSLLWFSSQLASLLPLLNDPSICLQALHAYSCFSYVPTPLTPIERIASLTAGNELIWQLDYSGTGLQLYGSRLLVDWQQAEEQVSTESEAISKLQSRLRAALQRQLHGHPTNEPIGIFLSGGLDSSIAAALLVQAGWTVRAYTLALEDQRISEAGYAQTVANWLGIPLRQVLLKPCQVRQALQSTVQALDLPYGDAVTIPFALLADAARDETALIVNGEGGDQLFAGWTNKPLIAASIYNSFPNQDQSLVEEYMRTFHRLWGLEKLIFQDVVRSASQPAAMLAMVQTALSAKECSAFLHRLRRAGLMLKGSQNIQPRATAIAHSRGLAVCSPFCDLDLAQLSFAIAPTLHLQQSCEKYILKRAVQDWLPAEIVWRRKRGMGVPVSQWCYGSLWKDLGRWLNPAVLKQQGHWQPDLPARLVSGNVRGTLQGRRVGESLWLLLMWQSWREQFLPSAPTAPSLHYPFDVPSWLWRMMRRGRRWS